jgi:hypothetical protein
MRTFEINGHGGFPACSSLQKLSHDRDSMQTAHQTLRQNPQRYSYLLSPSQQPSCSGYKSMSLEPKTLTASLRLKNEK